MFLKKTFYKTYSLLNSTKKYNDFLISKNNKFANNFVNYFLFYHYEQKTFPFQSIEDSVKWLNSLELPIRKLLSSYGKHSQGIGEGETVLKIINKTNSNSTHLNEYDIDHINGLWEVKKGTPILSGGTHKQIVTDFITVLTLLDKCIQSNKYLPTLLKYASISIQYNWNNTFKHKDTNKTSFTNISRTKFDYFFKEHGILEQIQQLYSLLKTVPPDTLEYKLHAELKFIFNFITEHNISSSYIQNTLKEEFIQNLIGLVCINEDYVYNVIYKRDFIDSWQFDGITRGNRIRFKSHIY